MAEARMRHLVVAQDYLPKIGGAHLWLYECYRRWSEPVTVLTCAWPAAATPETARATRAAANAAPGGAAAGPVAASDGVLEVVRTLPEIVEIDLASADCRAGFLTAARCIGALTATGPVTLHCLRAFPEGVCALLARWCAPGRTRLVVYAHGEEILVARSSRQLSWLARRVYRQADLVICNSRNTAGLVAELAPGACTLVIHPGVDSARFEAARAEARAGDRSAGWPVGTLVLCTVARMEPRKNQAAVIRVLARLRREGLPLAYVCAGDGEQRASLRALACGLGVQDWVRFPGVVAEADKPALLAACDVYVMPSQRHGEMIEGFGIVFLEAAAAALPAIAGHDGGQAEAVLDGRTGLLVDGADDDQLAAAVRQLVRDPALRSQLGSQGQAWARENDWSRVSERTRAALEGLSRRPHRRALTVAGAALLTLVLACSWLRLGPLALAREAARVAADHVLAAVYRKDLDLVAAEARLARVGPIKPGPESWLDLQRRVPGFRLLGTPPVAVPAVAPPFLQARSDVWALRELLQSVPLRQVAAQAPDEYHAMLAVAGVIGTAFDHGSDQLPGDDVKVCRPAAVVAAGHAGRRYWCEIAARSMVSAATALGWPARLVTASRSGYEWEHAVTELWSNQFSRWFVVDTDFNVVYEHAGMPASAWELAHLGPAWQADGTLRQRHIAPAKHGLHVIDMLPFYAYVHVDMRNDWCQRALAPGSPAGGDLATWYTTRAGFPPVLNARRRVDRQQDFDWPVNVASLGVRTARPLAGGGLELDLQLQAYSPVFGSLELRVDDGAWRTTDSLEPRVSFTPGQHTLAVRVVTSAGDRGPVARLAFEVPA